MKKENGKEDELMGSNYIRFDWAMKRLLRNKANFAVLEGFLTTLLNEKIVIQKLLESESNQEDEFDKYNRVDMLAENSKGELILIEVQNNNEYAYFQRMLFGTSKLVTEYINRGEGYDNVRKVYSVNIVYFSLGNGKDVVYHGKTEFRGIDEGDVLELTPFQKQTFKVDSVSQLYKVLEQCTRIYMPIRADPVSQAKIHQFEHTLQVWEKQMVLDRIRKIKLPYHRSSKTGIGYMDDLVWSELGDYVREMLRTEREDG